jgi:hypothetical protein
MNRHAGERRQSDVVTFDTDDAKRDFERDCSR